MIWIGEIRGVQLPDGDGVGVVVYRRESNHIVGDLHDIESERPALSRVNRELTDEMAVHGEFHDLARLIRIGIDSIAIADQQVPIGRQNHGQRPMQVDLVPVDQLAATFRLIFVAGIFDCEDLIVSCGGDVEHIVVRIVGRSSGADLKRDGVGPMCVARGDQDSALDDDVAAVQVQVETRHCPRQDIGNEDHHFISLVMHGEVPWALNHRTDNGVDQYSVGVDEQK